MNTALPTLLLLGKYGQLGRELNRTLLPLGNLVVLDIPELDFTQPDGVVQQIKSLHPDLIINAVAYTNVDQAETQRELCDQINSKTVVAVAKTAAEIDAGFIHISTDYVFDGSMNRPYIETDQTNPLNYYAESKLAAEIGIQASGASYWIMRTAWLYSLTRDDFVRKVLQWSRTKKELKIVDDQIGSPTWARLLAELITQALVAGKADLPQYIQATQGIYHLVGAGAVSRLDWVKKILELDSHPNEQILEKLLPAKTSEFPTPAMRPLRTPLNCGKFEKTFGLRVPAWDEMLAMAMEY